MDKSPQIVITGASGFVAKNLRKYLSEKNVHLISISRKNFKSFKNETKIINEIILTSRHCEDRLRTQRIQILM